MSDSLSKFLSLNYAKSLLYLFKVDSYSGSGYFSFIVSYIRSSSLSYISISY